MNLHLLLLKSSMALSSGRGRRLPRANNNKFSCLADSNPVKLTTCCKYILSLIKVGKCSLFQLRLQSINFHLKLENDISAVGDRTQVALLSLKLLFKVCLHEMKSVADSWFNGPLCCWKWYKFLIFFTYLPSYLPTYYLPSYLPTTYLPTTYLLTTYLPTYLLTTYLLTNYLTTYLPTNYLLPTYLQCNSPIQYSAIEPTENCVSCEWVFRLLGSSACRTFDIYLCHIFSLIPQVLVFNVFLSFETTSSAEWR